MKVSEAISSSSTACQTVGQVSLKEHLFLMVLTTRRQNKETPNLWALSFWEQNRSLPTRGSPSRPSNKLCTVQHTHRYKDTQTHIHTLWIIHEKGVSQSQWHAKSLTNAKSLTERQSLFYLDGGNHWCVCETVGGASVCVCWVCVVSDVLYSARSFCLAKPSSLWPDYCLSPHPPPFLPLFFTLAYSLLQFPSSRSLSLLFPCIHHSVLVIPLSKWRGTERKLAVGPPCLCALISYAEELYITNPLRKTHAIWRHCMFF